MVSLVSSVLIVESRVAIDKSERAELRLQGNWWRGIEIKRLSVAISVEKYLAGTGGRYNGGIDEYEAEASGEGIRKDNWKAVRNRD